MLIKLFFRLRSALAYTKSSRLYNEGDLNGALKALEGVTATKEYVLKSILHRADILHRAKRHKEAIQSYQEFLDKVESTGLLSQADLKYLIAYAEYFNGQAHLAHNQALATPVYKEEHIKLAKSASYLTTSEFMPAC
jgi:predicted Zn-dependent protease